MFARTVGMTPQPAGRRSRSAWSWDTASSCTDTPSFSGSPATKPMYLACLVALVVGGSGPLAIGGDIANPRRGPTDPATSLTSAT